MGCCAAQECMARTGTWIRVLGFGFWVWHLGFGFRFPGFGFRAESFRFSVRVSGFALFGHLCLGNYSRVIDFGYLVE